MATLIQPEASNITAPTQFVASRLETYAYRRFGRGSAPPLLGLQHFTGTLDFWDPAVTDPIARGREVILFENAGLGRSSGEVPDTMAGMAVHVLAFVDALGLIQVDVLGFSLGGVLAQLIALDRPSLVRKMLLVGTAPEGGEDIMHLEKPELKRILDDPNAQGLQRFVRLFFAPSESSQTAGQAYARRLAARPQDREPVSGPNVTAAQLTAFRAGGRRGAFREAPPDPSALPRRERRLRSDDFDPEFLCASRAFAARHAADLSGRRARFAVSVPRLVRATDVALSGF